MPCKLTMWFFHIEKKQITKDIPKRLHQKEQDLMSSSDQKGERLMTVAESKWWLLHQKYKKRLQALRGLICIVF